MSDSALFLGRVRHRRLGNPEHEFDYPVWFALVDLDEIQQLDRDLRFFSYNRLNLTGFDDRDHMGPEKRPVRKKLETWLRDRGVEYELGRVQLLTHLRILGHIFNPVSFYFIRDTEAQLRHAVAEVNNTFGETYCYLLDADGSRVRHEEEKVFHVSPFQPVDGRYRFHINEPGKRMTAHIDVLREGGRVFDTTLTVQRRELNSFSLLRTVARHPHMGLWTLALIHYQAARLWLKKAPFFSKPEAPAGAWRTRNG
jgi:DUF1365 family protein